MSLFADHILVYILHAQAVSTKAGVFLDAGVVGDNFDYYKHIMAL